MKKKTKYETNLANAIIEFKRNKYKCKDHKTNEIYIINSPKYIADRNAYIEKEHLEDIGGYRIRVESEVRMDVRKSQGIDRLCIEGYAQRDNMKDITILEAIKSLGEMLTDNKYEYLIPVNEEAETNKNKEMSLIMKIDNSNIDVKKIYSKMNEIASQIMISDHYNFIPGTKEDGKEYFEEKIYNIGKEIDNKFLGQITISEKLYKILGELETFVKSYSIPGVVERWRILNPYINNFDVVYDLIKDEPDLYNSIKNHEYSIHFSFYPTLEDIQKKEIYFKKIDEEDRKNNHQYGYSRIFQNEVINTLKTVMLNDFPELIEI